MNFTLEPFCMVNFHCFAGYESTRGRGSVLNSTVKISGGVTIGSGVLIGTGAQVLQYLTVGDNSTVGAGAVVVKNVQPEKTILGVLARATPERQGA